MTESNTFTADWEAAARGGLRPAPLFDRDRVKVNEDGKRNEKSS